MARSTTLVLLICGSLAAGALAQSAQFEGRLVSDIQYLPSQVLHPEDLERAVPLQRGEKYSAAKIAEAIDGLFATGRYDDIAVEVEPAGNGVVVRFVTKLTWFVGGVSVKGKIVAPPNRGQVATAAQLTLGAPFRDDDVAKGVESIRRLLQANGFYEAEVNPEIERDDDAQQVFLTVGVKEHKRAKYEMPVVTGDSKLSDNTVARATGWRYPLVHWWKRVTESRTRNGVQGLLSRYQSQDRLSARVELEKLDYDATRRRVKAHMNVKPGPKVEVKAVEAKVSKRVLKRYVPVFQEQSVDNDLLIEGQRNLRDYFQSKGYFDVDVDFRVVTKDPEHEVIEYVISRGSRQKLENVSIAGNKYFRTSDIRERMFMHEAAFNLRRGRYSEAFRKKDEENIANLYRSNGFRDVKVSTIVDRNYGEKPGRIGVTVQIVEGPQWIVDNVTLHGVEQLNREELTSQLDSLPGQPFSEVNLAADRNHTLTYYYARGFPNANFKTSWRLNGQPNHVDVTYTVTEGDRKYVREVITSGLSTTRQRVVDKHITLKPGDPLSSIEQTNIQKLFYDLGVFARVDTAIENPDGDTNHKYVLYNFDEAHRYSLAVGFGADIGRFGTPNANDLSAPAGSTGFSPLFSFDASRLNFLGIGHTVTLRGLYSNLEQRASLSYLAPRFQNVDGRNITFALLYDNALNVRTFASRRQEGSVQLSQRFSRASTGMFRFAYRRVSVGSVVIPVLLVPQLLQPVRLGILSANFAQDKRDNQADPHRGIYNAADIGVSGKFFGSQRSFARVLLRNATYHRVRGQTVLARQTQFGVIRPFAAPAGVGSSRVDLQACKLEYSIVSPK